MGIMESVAAIATAVTALVGLGLKIWWEQRKKAAAKKAERLSELSIAIQKAKTDEERQKYAEELHRLRAK